MMTSDDRQPVSLPPFPQEYRASCLLLHVSSLPSPYDIGDVGPAALTWIDHLHEAGQSWWQALPLGPTGYGNSPYQSLSSFAGNELLISPDWLIQDGLVTASDCTSSSTPENAVDYGRVMTFKRRLIEKAWSNFHTAGSAQLTAAFEQFCHDQAHCLEDYALFRALKVRYRGDYYLEWPAELVQRVPAVLLQARRDLAGQIDQVRFAQFLLSRQGERLKNHARDKGVRLVGDLPFFVSPDSSDVWANPELFLLDERQRPRIVAGVPPDYFSSQGQLWGNPVYNWDALRQTGCRWWIDRIRALLAHVDVIRLDHFRGFAAAWHVPAGATTAQSGQWMPGLGADFFTAVKSELGVLPFIAEDLGLITPEVGALRDQFHVPGTRVLQFAFDGHSDNPYLPHNYVPNTVVYTGTHDNPTTREWYEELPPNQRQDLWRYLKEPEGESSQVAWELMRLAWSSVAALAMAPLQDLLNLGAEARMNVPGRAGGNWTWRCTEKMLSSSAFQSLRELTASTDRAGLHGRLAGERAEAVAGVNCPVTWLNSNQARAADDPREAGPPPARSWGAHAMTEMTSGNQGKSFPLGADVCPDGVNFSIFSKHSTAVDLLLFETVDDSKPSRVVTLDPLKNRTYHYWHTFVPGVKTGQLYAYRVRGPYAPERGLRFDPDKVLLDPYGKCVARPPGYCRQAACHPGDNTAVAIKSVVADPSRYDWEGDSPLRRPFAKTVLYEMHVGGFTRHPSSGIAVGRRGTYAGLAEKIPYLQDLGVTAVELLPVFAFDEQDGPGGLGNYWGYAPLSFFAPHDGYSSRRDPLGPLDEFRDMVKALHRAGIEVLLDVVYNHTTEGNETGPTLCFRGLANGTYYLLGEGQASYANYSGCGNTLNANESVCRRLILDSLRYWASEMHVDGFRFDLASILSRDSLGRPMENPPILWDIESDPVLANVKLIAEAWDAAGLYQVGRFVGDSWKEWNGRFRDDVRAFLKGDNGMVRPVAHRLMGSPDLYEHKERGPEESINFITCHDGLTLNDLVSYNRKHNEENREDNRDGIDNNLSWNCGEEGSTQNPAVERLRNRQVKNFLTLTLLAVGTPMLLMGDEMRRTQRGNNNAYCQNNETSWLDWDLLVRHADIHRFAKQLISLRLNGIGPIDGSDMTLTELLRRQPVQWHGVRLDAPDWSYDSHSLAASVRLLGDRVVLLLMVNAYWEALQFEIPAVNEFGKPWRRCVDTFLDSPDDICDWAEGPLVSGATYPVQPRSVVLLAAHAQGRTSRSKDLQELEGRQP